MSTDAKPPVVVGFPHLLTERQAAVALCVSIDTLRRERQRRRIGYILIGGRPRYTVRQLEAYIASREVKPCDEDSNQLAPDKLATTGLAGGPIARSGAERGLTPTLDRRAEHRLALMILQPLESHSPNGSQRMSAPTEQHQTKLRSPASLLGTTNGTANMSLVPRPRGSVSR